MMSGIFLYLIFLMVIFIFLGYKVITKRRHEKQAAEEREDDVFYDAVKNIRRDR